MSADAGLTLAELTAYLHSRLTARERFVRIGDVLRLIDPRHEAPTLVEPDVAQARIDIIASAADEREAHLDAVQDRYDRATQAVEDDR